MTGVIHSLAQEFAYAVGVSKKEKKKKDPSLDISLYDHFAYIYLNIKMQVWC